MRCFALSVFRRNWKKNGYGITGGACRLINLLTTNMLTAPLHLCILSHHLRGPIFLSFTPVDQRIPYFQIMRLLVVAVLVAVALACEHGGKKYADGEEWVGILFS